MALTSVTIASNTTKPKDIAYAAITATDTQGFTFTLSTTAPETGVNAQIVEITSDANYFWSYQDSQVAAAGTMVPVLAYEKLRAEVAGKALTIYMKTAAGTANVSVVQV